MRRTAVVEGVFDHFVEQPATALNAVGHQQITVCNHARDHAIFANAPDDVVKFGMQQEKLDQTACWPAAAWQFGVERRKAGWNGVVGQAAELVAEP